MLHTEARAADRTVCLHLAFNDDRVSCPTPSTTGASYTCSPSNGWSTALGHTVELWDYDPGGTDEFIGYFSTDRNPGLSTCFTFPWEGEPYHRGEANPDVYVRYQYEASAQPNGVYFQAQDGDGDRFGAVQWIAQRYNNRLAGQTCWINGGGILYPNSSGSSNETMAMGAIDGMAAALVPFVDVEDPLPSRKINVPIDNSLCGTGCVNGQSEANFTWTKATQVDVLTHETGHILHLRAWDGQAPRPDYSRNGDSGWDPHEYEWEEAAFYEGFAT